MPEDTPVETPAAAPVAATATAPVDFEKEGKVAAAERDILLAFINDFRRSLDKELELTQARLVRARQG